MTSPEDESRIGSASPSCDKEGNSMKVSASEKKRCSKCQIIKRRGRIRVICETKRHKQRQG